MTIDVAVFVYDSVCCVRLFVNIGKYIYRFFECSIDVDNMTMKTKHIKTVLRGVLISNNTDRIYILSQKQP